MPTRQVVLVLTIVVAGLAAHSLGVAADGFPTLRSPYPIFLVLLVFLGIHPLLVALIYALCFALWSLQLFRGSPRIPWRSLILFAVSAALSVAWFVGGWKYGLKYEGPTFVYGALTLNIVAAVLLTVLFVHNRKLPAFATSAVFHFLLFSWLCTYAIPYLGETP